MYFKDCSVSMGDSSSENKHNSNKTDYQLLLISNLKKEIEVARKLDPEKLAAEIRKIGFSCQQCGKCCRQVWGDNRVSILPSEIKKICKFTGLSNLEVAEPFVPDELSPGELVRHKEKRVEIEGRNEDNPDKLLRDSEEKKDLSLEKLQNIQAHAKNRSAKVNESFELPEHLLEDIDSEGNIHAFGWILRRKRNGDCIFLQENSNKCRIYPSRPMLCSTYPFFIEDLSLKICECEGVSHPISVKDSVELAKLLVFRFISELEDTLTLYEKFTNFEKDKTGPELAKNSLKKGICSYVVHDSTGNNKISY